MLFRSLLSLLCAATASAAGPVVEMKTSMGSITIELAPDRAPKTVENFLQYVKEGFYKGTIFHRVIPGFMVQGGGFGEDMRQKPTRAPIALESQNGLKNDTGTIAMARTSNPNSATASGPCALTAAFHKSSSRNVPACTETTSAGSSAASATSRSRTLRSWPPAWA